ncbi:putative lrr receptor-like serine/threonine-protein kinase, partial [Quercus suber]
RILNSIFQKWGISAPSGQWNISGELCSGVAIDSTDIDNQNYNPLIKCECSANSTCHIAQLKVNDKVVGVIPDELWSLTYLFNLNLANNYLTGNLSASIGNLTRMQYLGFAVNALSGTVPKELGNLTNLLSLSILRNDFTGSLPSELGNLLKLEQLYIGSSGISGVIPSTFANLRNLEIVKLGGNSFEGPIPSTFSNLTSLTDLIISDLSHGSSSLAFIKDMKSLRSLVLRNNKISDSIPSNIGDYQQLRLLDLSFNNITGQIPDVLFNLSSLSHFVLPSGLNCLQRDYNFSIKCGGPQITSSSGIVYESDIPTENESQELGSASYYVINTGRWAVSNVGYFNGTYNPHYTSSSSSRFSNTLDSELFQTARLSASSLRYYGLGLENGNYTVSLQFAETAFNNSKSWKSLGRRVFNIYIQGNLVVKDFDIRKNASGTSFRAVQIQYNKVQVSENYLEIHLFWAGKGTCCIPDKGTYGPSISALSATPEFIPTVNNRPPSSNKNRTGLIVGLIVGVGILSFLSVFVVIYIVQRRKPPTNDDEEIISGRPNFDKNLVEEEKMYLLDWTWQLYENNREVELVDPTLSEINEEDVKRVIRVSLLCTQASPTLRPSMSRVVAMLLGDTKVGTVTSRPGYLTDWKFDDITSSRSGPSGVKAKETVSIYHDSSESTIMVGHADNSPVNASKLMLGKIIKNPSNFFFFFADVCDKT